MLQNGIAVVRGQLIDLHFLRPFLIQTEVGNHLVENQLGLDGFELRLHPIRIKTERDISAFKAASAGILFDLDSHRARKRLRQHKGDERGGDGYQQENRQNYRFANANDPPVVQEMELGFRRVK